LAPQELRSSANNLDLVRFAAASLVLVSHSYTLTARGGEPALFNYETLGGFAVAVFFVISGFLVTGSWEREPHLAAFVRNRALRIMPALIGVVAIAALVLGPVLSPLPAREYFVHPQTWAYFHNLTFTQLNYSLPLVFATNPFPHAVNGSLWTLPIEVAMYGLLAVLGICGLLRRNVVTALVLALAGVWLIGGPALLEHLAPFAPPVLPPVPVARLALWFFTGSAFWLWRHRIVYRTWLAVALLVLAWITQGYDAGHAVLHVAMPYVVLWFAQLDLGQPLRFAGHGDFSYGMYLYAFPVQQTFAHFGGATWPLPLYIGASFVVTLACAMVSWRCIEAPALRLKRRMRRAGAVLQGEAVVPRAPGVP